MSFPQEEEEQASQVRALDALFFGGIILRLCVLAFEGAENADRHFDVIRFITSTGRLPASNLLSQSYHPPLYYLMMAGVYGWWHEEAIIHFMSFLISAANLLLIRRLLDIEVIAQQSWRVVAFALICSGPQIVMFGGYISNDTLAMLVGTMTFVAAVRYVCEPGRGWFYLLAFTLGLGLLTKLSFLPIAPALTVVVAVLERIRRPSRFVRSMTEFCLIWLVLGSYKFIDNGVRLGHPFVSNLDMTTPFMLQQMGTWKGVRSLIDINVFKLIRRPILQVHNTFSYPLLFYGTFWYPHIPDSTFLANIYGYQWVGSLIYSTAVLPTIAFLIGAGGAMRRVMTIAHGAARMLGPRDWILAMALIMLLANVSIVLAAGISYDVWSCFQSRLCFPALVPAAVLFMHGSAALPDRWRAGHLFRVAAWATAAGGVLYFVVEIAFAYGLLPRGPRLSAG